MNGKSQNVWKGYKNYPVVESKLIFVGRIRWFTLNQTKCVFRGNKLGKIVEPLTFTECGGS